MRKLLLGCLLLAGLAAAQNRILLVLLKSASALAYYSEDGKLLASIPVGQHPHEMVFSADGRYLYTSDNGTMRVENPGAGGNSLSVIDVAARRKIADISLGKFHRPHGIALDKQTGHLLVTTEAPDQLLIVDPVSRGVLRSFPTKGKTSHMVTIGPGAQWAFVSNSGSSNISAINLASGEVKLIATGNRPEGSVLSKDGKELYVCNREENSITVIDTGTQSAIAIIKTGQGPVRIGITPDGSKLVYALMKEKKLGIADPKARRQIDYILLTQNPVSLSISRDGKLAFASAEEQDAVFLVSLETKHIQSEIKTEKGAGPDPVLEAPF
jgi:YVTN family beta-propeller protein